MIQSKSRMEWLDAVEKLTKLVEGWAQSDEWATRRVTVSVRDSEGKRYDATGLRLQKETKQVLLEPVSDQVPEVEGVVDLYLMPRYDDIATLRLKGEQWFIQYVSDNDSDKANLDDSPPAELTREEFLRVVNEMAEHG